MNLPAVLRSASLVALILASSAASCQNSQSYLNDIGGTAYGINIPVENGFINVSNGNLHLEFPLASPPQRGALNLTEKVVYDSRIWMFSPFGTHGSYHWWPYNIPGNTTTSGGWQFVSGAEVGTTSQSFSSQSSSPCSDPNEPQPVLTTDPGNGITTFTYYTQTSVRWTDPSGTVHPFSAYISSVSSDCDPSQDSTSLNGGIATDGSGYQIPSDSNGNIAVIASDGTQVYPTIADRYGNFLSRDGGGNVIDDTGRVPVIVATNGNTTYYDVLAPNGTINNNGLRVRYTVTTALVPVSTNFGQSDTYEWLSPQAPGQTPFLNPVQSILLPDGVSKYTFAYDSYGGLSAVTLPTGGTINYGYSNFVDSSTTSNRWLSSRTVGSNPATAITPRVLTNCANYSTGCKESVTVHRPSGDESLYEMVLNNGAWAVTSTAYTGSVSGGQRLVQTSNSNTYTNGCSDASQCVGANYISQSLTTTELFPSSAQSGSPAIYTQNQTTYNPSNSTPSSVREWDYLPVSSAMSTTTAPNVTPTRETDYTYAGNDLSQVKVLDRSGNPAGLTTYTYTSNATPTSGITGHTTLSPGGPYLQSVSHWVNTSPNAPTTATYTTDDTGTVTRILDARNNATTIAYQCSNSLPYQTTNALQQTIRSGYDCNSGAITSTQDPNDLAAGRSGTTYSYEATAGRLFTRTLADGGKTTYSYPSLNETDVAVSATPDPTITSRTILDAFGRTSASIAGGVETDTTYDSNGRANCTSNPFTSTPTGNTCVVSYDGLDRPLRQSLQDGTSFRTWSYSANTATAMDETNAAWTRTVDAFGRLKSVVEPAPSGNTATAYSYDGLGNIATITQAGNAAIGDVPRIRTFTHDSLSRLVCTSTPESAQRGSSQPSCPANATVPNPAGVIGYTYDAAGNLITQTDARGIVRTSHYDPLNRLTTTQSSDGSINNALQYDAGGAAQNAIGRLSRADGSGYRASEQYLYDAIGRNTTKYQYITGDASWGLTAAATYDLAGNITSLTYPDGRQINQTWDAAGRLTKIGEGGNMQTYLQNILYNPDGSLNILTLGNGVQQTTVENNRLQVQQVTVSNPLAPVNSQTLLSHYYCYVNCPNGGVANNGNLWWIADGLNGGKTQGFGYDSLNRINSFSIAGRLKEQYVIDSFGNLSGFAGGRATTTFDSTNRINNLPCAASLSPFDAAGNQLCDSDANGGVRQYSYDANNRVTQIASLGVATPFETYTYSADGNRAEKTSYADGSFTEYAYFGGQPIAEKDQTGAWTDYVYANGQKIARIQPTDQRYHLTGTNLPTQDGNRWTVGPVTFPSGLTIQAGDVLSYRIYQHNAHAGISLGFTDKSNSDWYCGNCKYSVTQSDAWVNVSVALGGTVASPGPMVGKVFSYFQLGNFQGGPDGEFDVMLADLTLVRVDGSVVQFPVTQGATWWGGETPNESGTSYAGETVSAASVQVSAIGPVQRYHLTGTNLPTQDGNRWTVGPVTFPSGLTIQAGDVLSYRIYQHNAHAGISLGFTDNSNSDWYCGNCKYSVTQSDAWVNVLVALGGTVASPGPMVGKVFNYFQLGNYQGSPNGEFDVLLGDLALARVDGSVVQFPVAQGAAWWGGDTPNESGTSYAGETVSASSGQIGVLNPVHFFLGDQLGTAQMEFSSGGWPLWKGEFAPFGQEIDTQTTANNYKFTGLERDSESDSDHTQYRQLNYRQGRWTSPDPYDGSTDLSNPQTLNRYSYVNNMPLIFSDPSGLSPFGGISLDGGGNPWSGVGGCVGAIASGGGNVAADAGCAFELFNIVESLFYHPKFTASHTPRPNARPWDEHGSYRTKPYTSAADLLGLNSQGCEFGACGSSFQNPVAVGAATAACIEAEPCGAIGGLILGAGILYHGYELYTAGKENIRPSWAEKYGLPRPGESGNQFADRVCKAEYGVGGCPGGTGPGSDYNKLKKWADRRGK